MAVQDKKYTVADVYQEAGQLLQTEMLALKKRPLTNDEEEKMKQLGKLISKIVLKEMKTI
ncbi:hypothetical protein HZB07_02275 [Candidatus Saganbacteria bacterium]|nr:hypothetical protein [Candidatus Saganbacteria bacterium]